MMSMNLSHIAILNIDGAYYRCIFNGISNSASKSLLNQKHGTLQIIKNFKVYIKMEFW